MSTHEWSLDDENREDALDVLQDTSRWELTEHDWGLADQTVRLMLAALDAHDPVLFRKATDQLDAISPFRGKTAGTEPEVPAPEPTRDLINDTIHELGRR